MLIVMKPDATDQQIEEVLKVIRDLGFKPHAMPGATRTAIGITGNQGAIDPGNFENLAGVAEAIRVSKPYKLVSRDIKNEDTVVRIGEAEIGGIEHAIIAGPCAVESLEQTMEIAEIVASCGVKFFRGGAFKPRTSPYSFQGLGEEGLKILARVRELLGEAGDVFHDQRHDCGELGGLAQQEIQRLNNTTGKILELELKKVKYLRSLSFIQGTAVNALP